MILFELSIEIILMKLSKHTGRILFQLQESFFLVIVTI